jgi:hypothetical protein
LAELFLFINFLFASFSEESCLMKNITIYQTNRHIPRYFAIVKDDVAVEIDFKKEVLHISDVLPGTTFYARLINEQYIEIKTDNRYYNIVLDRYKTLIGKATLTGVLS